jgi:hypothetical protein
MNITAQTLVALGIMASAGSIVWQLLKPRGDDSLARWSILYIDRDARMQRAAVRVLSVHPMERCITTAGGHGRRRTFKVSKIVEARDLETGMPVNVPRWVEAFEADQGRAPQGWRGWVRGMALPK